MMSESVGKRVDAQEAQNYVVQRRYPVRNVDKEAKREVEEVMPTPPFDRTISPHGRAITLRSRPLLEYSRVVS